ncbi:sterol desaturase family protein [Marinobacter sp. CHS3-4]|uniref:sterol desaturase family protein n=1 Tax=Marinobacter sp. CHS3-4 TaxID=3045174 RepID=UPI0024B61898|nr:sterol desaturase family protein [Marinobacter sp. CHS3-4]MDI9244266.1 sterol desaturase family protein [Marinobacter sp. CHS3-4]
MIEYSLALAAVLFVFERLKPGSQVESSVGWYVRALLINLLQLAVLVVGVFTWNRWFESASIFALKDSVPAWIGGFLAYFVFTFLFYWWHRWKHSSNLLWRLFHQLHHSPRRIEVLAANYLHPLDTASGLILGSFICSALLGLGVEGVAWYSLYLSCMSYFIHANIRVPHWIGYVIQTPQMHRRHHKFGKHDTNYSDIVWWDMLFGTYENPKTPCEQCGFTKDREEQVLGMLAFRDVHSR